MQKGKKGFSQRLFHCLRLLNQVEETQKSLNLVFMVCSIIIQILAFTSLTKIGMIDKQLIFGNYYIALGCLGFTVLVIAQIIVCFLYSKSIWLYLQMTFFRYIIFPYLLQFLTLETLNSIHLSLQISILLAFLLICISFLFTNFVVIEFFKMKKLYKKGLPFTFMTLSTEISLSLLQITKLNAIYSIISIEFVIISFLIRERIKKQLKVCLQLKIISLSNLVSLFFSALIITDLFILDTYSLLQFVKSGLIGLVFFILAESSLTTGQMPNEQKILQAQASLQEFYNMIQIMIDQIESFKLTQNINFFQSYLFVFCYKHLSICDQPHCLLMHSSAIQQIKNCTEAKNIKIILQKIIKKIEKIFQTYEKLNVEDIDLKLAFLKFYSHLLPNKFKINQLISEIESFNLSWDKQRDLYEIKMIAKQIQLATELTDVSKSDDEYIEFKKIIASFISCLIEFWATFYEQRVDLNLLMSLSERLFPLKNRIQSLWKSHLNEQKFASWNILKLYSIYRKKILNDYTNGCIIQDYTHILEERLKEKRQLNYISAETQQAIISISLTESSLGDIVSVNPQICKIFNYNKTQFQRLRVNDIMPCIYSLAHDDILSRFLKNKNKKINPDQRFLFGKNKSSFIFPIYLQLQKMMCNSNDQLIFIANIKQPKIKNSPIYTIIDMEGDLKDWTSAFHHIFLKKKSKSYKKIQKNIQQLIPSFFEITQKDLQKEEYEYDEKFHTKINGQQSQISFTATRLYIKDKCIGYLVKGTNQSYLGKPFKNEAQGINIFQTKLKDIDIGFHNEFNSKNLRYQIPNKSQIMNIGTLLSQFTIPFFQCEDIASILKLNEKAENNYGSEIKTIRLINGHFQRVQQEESFDTDDDCLSKQKISVVTKIQQMREQITSQESFNITSYFKLILIFFALVVAVMSFGMTLATTNFVGLQKAQFVGQNFINHIRQKVPEFLSYVLFLEKHPSNPSFTSKLKAVEQDLISKVVQSTIQQSKKEQILYIIFLKEQVKLISLLSPQFLNFQIQQLINIEDILIPLYVLLSLLILFFVIVVAIHNCYKSQLFSIYNIFLVIEENKLKMAYQECKNLLKRLLEDQENELAKKTQGLDNIEYENVEAQIEFEKTKKFKKSNRWKDKLVLIKLLSPIVLLIGFNIVSILIINSLRIRFYNQQKAAEMVGNVYTQSSIAFMNKYYQAQNQKIPYLSNYFFEDLQLLEKMIYQNSQDNMKYIYLLQAHLCDENLDSEIGQDFSLACHSNQSILHSGVSNLINYMFQAIKSKNQSDADWIRLFEIQYSYINPTLKYILSLVNQQMNTQIQQIQANMNILALLFFVFVVLSVIFIYCYPIQNMAEEFCFTKDLITIIPSEKETQPVEAMAMITTEAMQNF